MLIAILLALNIAVCICLIAVVLLQRSEGGALGIGGGGGGGGFMNSRGTGNLLTRATALLATGFFITSLLLSILAGWRPAGPTLINQATQQSPVVNPQGPSILEQLQKQQPQGPQVPQSK
jgi:preprotein translocase subunit SecG